MNSLYKERLYLEKGQFIIIFSRKPKFSAEHIKFSSKVVFEIFSEHMQISRKNMPSEQIICKYASLAAFVSRTCVQNVSQYFTETVILITHSAKNLKNDATIKILLHRRFFMILPTGFLFIKIAHCL
jgi:hypothetical protein